VGLALCKMKQQLIGDACDVGLKMLALDQMLGLSPGWSQNRFHHQAHADQGRSEPVRTRFASPRTRDKLAHCEACLQHELDCLLALGSAEGAVSTAPDCHDLCLSLIQKTRWIPSKQCSKDERDAERVPERAAESLQAPAIPTIHQILAFSIQISA
jgi:hypothetical protein